MRGSFFNASDREMKNLLCGIGTSEIVRDCIKFSNYPFEPSIIYPNGTVSASEIDWICTNSVPPKVKVGSDILFVSAEFKEELIAFAKHNRVELTEPLWNWDWILEPYLDTEFTPENEARTTKLLLDAGFETVEIESIRNEVGKQMLKYNFETMLWDWTSLSLADVLSAMRVKYNQTEFRAFYVRAIEIELRQRN